MKAWSENSRHDGARSSDLRQPEVKSRQLAIKIQILIREHVWPWSLKRAPADESAELFMEPEIFGKLSKPVGSPQVFIAVIIGVVVSVPRREREREREKTGV